MKSLVVDRLLAQSCGLMGVEVMNSTLQYDRAVVGLFSSLYFGNRMVVVYYSGTLMYTSLYGDRSLDRRYGDGVMSVRVTEFQTYAVYINDYVKDSDGRSNHAWIVPTVFHSLRSINDPWYLEDDRNPWLWRKSNGILAWKAR